MGFFNHKQELYYFEYAGEVFTFTTSNKDITFQNRIYKSDRYLKRTKITNQGSNEKAPELTIDMTKDNPVVEWFKFDSTYKEVQLQIIQVNTDDLTDFTYLWSGTILSNTLKSNSATLQCFSKEQVLESNLCRFTCQYQCNYQVYNDDCGLNEEDYSFYTTITAIAADGINLTIADNPNLPDNTFKSGVIRKTDTGKELLITQDSGTEVRIWYPMEGLKVGDSVQLIWGCDNLPTTCHKKFNNLDRYMGEPFTPSADPFMGSIDASDSDGLNIISYNSENSDEIVGGLFGITREQLNKLLGN